MTVKTFQCEICGDAYIGEEAPSQCPFCGANKKHIVLAKDYNINNNITLTETEQNNILKAIQLEVSNAEFYFAGALIAKDKELKARFKAIGKVESEHASLLSKLTKTQTPPISRKNEIEATDEELNAESETRETNATNHYKEFLKQATNSRVKQVFAAIIEIEKTHHDLTEN